MYCDQCLQHGSTTEECTQAQMVIEFVHIRAVVVLCLVVFEVGASEVSKGEYSDLNEAGVETVLMTRQCAVTDARDSWMQRCWSSSDVVESTLKRRRSVRCHCGSILSLTNPWGGGNTQKAQAQSPNLSYLLSTGAKTTYCRL